MKQIRLKYSISLMTTEKNRILHKKTTHLKTNIQNYTTAKKDLKLSKTISTNTQIVQNTKAKQLLFILKKIPQRKSAAKSQYKKLLLFYVTHFLSVKKLNHWKTCFVFTQEYLSINLFFLTLFEIQDRKKSELFRAKISLINTDTQVSKTLKVFITDVLASLDKNYDLKKITNITTFKIGFSFQFDKVKCYTFKREQ